MDNVYIYSKKLGNQTLLVALNSENKKKEIELKWIESLCGKYSSLSDLISNRSAEVINGKLVLQPLSGNVFKVNK